jgi:hypothetical protein
VYGKPHDNLISANASGLYSGEINSTTSIAIVSIGDTTVIYSTTMDNAEITITESTFTTAGIIIQTDLTFLSEINNPSTDDHTSYDVTITNTNAITLYEPRSTILSNHTVTIESDDTITKELSDTTMNENIPTAIPFIGISLLPECVYKNTLCICRDPNNSEECTECCQALAVDDSSPIEVQRFGISYPTSNIDVNTPPTLVSSSGIEVFQITKTEQDVLTITTDILPSMFANLNDPILKLPSNYELNIPIITSNDENPNKVESYDMPLDTLDITDAKTGSSRSGSNIASPTVDVTIKNVDGQRPITSIPQSEDRVPYILSFALFGLLLVGAAVLSYDRFKRRVASFGDCNLPPCEPIATISRTSIIKCGSTNCCMNSIRLHLETNPECSSGSSNSLATWKVPYSQDDSVCMQHVIANTQYYINQLNELNSESISQLSSVDFEDQSV